MTIQDLDKKILKTVLYLNCQGCNKTKIKHKKGVFVMYTKMMSQFEILDTEMLASIEGGTDWGTVGKGAVYGAGIGVAMCTVGGLLTGGSAWAMTAGCAWAGAKIGGSITAIADNLWP